MTQLQLTRTGLREGGISQQVDRTIGCAGSHHIGDADRAPLETRCLKIVQELGFSGTDVIPGQTHQLQRCITTETIGIK